MNPESADIGYNGVEDRDNRKIIYDNAAATMPNMDSIPCCPLGALLELIPHTGFDGIKLNDYNDGKTIWTDIFHWKAYSTPIRIADTPLDAVYEAVVYLLENGVHKRRTRYGCHAI